MLRAFKFPRNAALRVAFELLVWCPLFVPTALCLETVEEAARNARFLIASQSIGTLASVYPYRSHRAIPDISSEYEISQSLPISTPDLSGHAFALPEYYAPCYPSNGSLLFIISRLSQNAKNILGEDNEPPSHVNHFSEWSSERFGAYHRGSHAASEQMIINGDKESIEKVEVEGGMVLKWKQSGQATFSVQEWPLSPSPVSRPRVALIGNLTLISDVWSSSNSPDHRTMVDDDNELDEIEKCYLAYHLDSRRWLPGKGGFHDIAWARLDPQAVYYVGGFGGLHYIGYIPIDLYRRSG